MKLKGIFIIIAISILVQTLICEENINVPILQYCKKLFSYKDLYNFKLYNEKIIFVKREGYSNNYVENIFSYDRITKVFKFMFSPLSIEHINNSTNVNIYKLFLINDNIYFIVPISMDKINYSLFSLNINTLNIQKIYTYEEMFEYRYLKNQSLFNSKEFISLSGSNESFYIYNIDDNSFNTVKINNKIYNEIKYIPAISMGRNEKEIILSYLTKQYELKLIFYEYKDENILSEYKFNFESNGIMKNGFSKIYFSPCKKYILLIHSAYGIWLLDITQNKLYLLIENKYYLKHRKVFYVADWSKDSSEVLLGYQGYLYTLNLKEYLSMENLKKIPFDFHKYD